LQIKEAVKVKRSSVVVACSLVFFFSLIAYAASPAVTAGARAVDEAWVKAMTGNDLNAVMACYSRDAVMWLPEAPEAKGHEAIREAYAGLLEANTVTKATLTNARYETAGRLSVGWGNFSLTLLPKSGDKPVVMSGRFSVIAKQEGDKWVYVVDHASPHPPLKPQGK